MSAERNIILEYSKRREAFVRLGFYLFITFFAIANLSRVRAEGGFKLKIPLLEGFAIDTGDLVVFGPLAILVMVIWYDRAWFNLLKLRRSIIKLLETRQKSVDAVEFHLLAKPFNFETKSIDFDSFKTWIPNFVQGGFSRGESWLARRFGRARIPTWTQVQKTTSHCLLGLPSRSVYIFALASVGSLLIEYVQFRQKDTCSSSWLDPIIGVPWFTDGFEPHWPRFPEVDVVWIYPPWYPIFYAFVVIFLVKRILNPPTMKST